jgi:formamidopyrimidine-DNA glycosylase
MFPAPERGRLDKAHMPELPDIVIYLEALETRILGQTLEAVRIVSPFLLRTANPPFASASGNATPPPR